MEEPRQNEILSKDIRTATVLEVMENGQGMKLWLYDHGGVPVSFELSNDEVALYGLKGQVKKGIEIRFKIPDLITPVDIEFV